MMKHTAPSGTFLAELCDQVAAMKPGERLAVDMHTLKMDIPSFYHNDTHFNPADRVLGNIIGAAYTHSYSVSLEGVVTFCRHEETGQRYYADPDRR